MLRRTSNAYSAVLDFCGDVAGIAIGLMAIAISLEVMLRNVGTQTMPWLIEVTEYGIFVITFVASPWALRAGVHVRLDMLLRWVPRQAAVPVELMANGFGLLICVVLAYYAVVVTWQSYSDKAQIFKTLVFPEWWLLWVIPVSLALLGFEFIVAMIRAWRGRNTLLQCQSGG